MKKQQGKSKLMIKQIVDSFKNDKAQIVLFTKGIKKLYGIKVKKLIK